ncbi:MAG: efflux RND transporter permease subunit [Candidatus Sumerlaeota bacterium]|nr:efflux RND transporter permease subunit [Candidatus Sumerlaeota bacterium]
MPASPGRLFRLVVRRPVATLMLISAIALMGVVSYFNLPVLLIPEFALPTIHVYAGCRGLSIDETERQILKPIEALLATTPKVREIESWARPGFARVRVHYEFGSDMRFAQLDLQDKVSGIARTFEDQNFYSDVETEETSEFEANFMFCAVVGPADEATLNQVATERIEPVLSAIDGIAGVDVGGGRWRTIDVAFETDLLEAYKIPMQRVLARLRGAVTENFVLGQIEGPGETWHVVLRNRFQSVQDIRNTVLDDKGIVRLSDVARVELREHEPDYLSHYNGKTNVSLSLRKEADANPLQLSKKVKAAIEDIKATLPPGYDIEIGFNAADFISDVLDQMTLAALKGALLAMAVLFFFLRSVRMSLIVFAALPISIIATFNLMYFCGMSINVLTVLGLALAVGLLVDNSIVVLENIFRHYQRGYGAVGAAEQGVGQVWRALVATTSTNLIVFTPILFAEGEIRIIFREGALAIIFPQLMALFVSLTLVPMLTARMLLLNRDPADLGRGLFGWRTRLREAIRRRNPYWPAWRLRPRRVFRETYGAVLRSALRHRIRLLAIVALVILLTWHICLPRIASGVMQSNQESNYFPVYIQTPAGGDLNELSRATSLAEQAILQDPGVKSTRAWGGKDDGSTIFVELKKAAERRKSSDQIQSSILDEIGPIPGAVTSLTSFNPDTKQTLRLRRGGEVEIIGPDEAALKAAADVLGAQIEALPQVARTELESDQSSPEYHYVLDHERAALFHVTPQDVARLMQTTQRDGQFTQLFMEEGTHQTSIYLRPAEEEKGNPPIEEIQRLRVLTELGESAPLKDLGHFLISGGERRIVHHNLQRVLNLDYYLEPGVGRKPSDDAKVHNDIAELLKTVRLPAGITASMSGDRRKAEENVNQVRWMIGVTILLTYMVMASIFESLLTPFVIMVAVPLGALGVFWVMAFGGIEANPIAMFGMLLLVGIVVNNGIVLLDFVSVMRREHGYRRTRAVLEGCYARLRPILMTTSCTTLGLLPLALQQSEDFPWSSLATVVISGLLSSAVLTLFVVPALLMTAEDALAYLRRALVWGRRQAVERPVGALVGLLARARIVWPFRQVAVAGPALPVDLGGAIGVGIDSSTAAERRPPLSGEALGDGLQVVMRWVYMTYPIFHPRKLAWIAPSTRYKVGRRPPQGVDALRGVGFTLQRGMCGLLGPNGAGKSTLMQIMAGLLRPTRGYVEVCGYNLAVERDRARREIGYLPQHFGVPEDFTARQFLEYHALLMGLADRASRRRRIEDALETVNLRDVAGRRIGGYSGGMKQRLGIARILLKLPRLLIVDEPTAGLDPIERVKFRNLLSRLSEGRIVVFSTHIIEDITSICGSLIVIREGQVVCQDTPAGLARRWRGRVWLYDGSAAESAELGRIAHILWERPRDGGVQYRLICPFPPRPGGRPVEPTLEDAYMAILLESRPALPRPASAGECDA